MKPDEAEQSAPGAHLEALLARMAGHAAAAVVRAMLADPTAAQ